MPLDDSLSLLAKGYGWLPDKRRTAGGRTVLPEPVVGTLFGKCAVHTLGGHPHRVRKSMFVALLMGDGIGPLVERTTAAWDDAVQTWSQRRPIVLFEEAATCSPARSPAGPASR